MVSVNGSVESTASAAERIMIIMSIHQNVLTRPQKPQLKDITPAWLRTLKVILKFETHEGPMHLLVAHLDDHSVIPFFIFKSMRFNYLFNGLFNYNHNCWFSWPRLQATMLWCHFGPQGQNICWMRPRHSVRKEVSGWNVLILLILLDSLASLESVRRVLGREFFVINGFQTQNLLL